MENGKLFTVSDEALIRHREKQLKPGVFNHRLRDQSCTFFSALLTESADYTAKGTVRAEDLETALKSREE